MKAHESSGKGSPSVTSQRMSARASGLKSRFIQSLNGSLPQPTFTLSGKLARFRRDLAFVNLLSLVLLARNASARRPTPIRIVWSAASPQAKFEDATSWSAQMYTAFVGVDHSWPGWNALRSLLH